jgi:cytochrome P450/NADPH-cytochrome P450 reductase
VAFADEGIGQFRAAEQGGANLPTARPGTSRCNYPPGITYRVGDHLSVVPRNDPALVDSVARR